MIARLDEEHLVEGNHTARDRPAFGIAHEAAPQRPQALDEPARALVCRRAADCDLYTAAAFLLYQPHLHGPHPSLSVA